MKREDLRAIEGLSEAQVDAVMTLAGRDSAAAHSREEALQQQLNAAQQGLEDKAEIDQAITDILTSTDETKRQELYTFVLTRLHEDAVYIPLTFETNKALYTSDLKGVHFGTDQYDVDFASMYFE